MGYRNRFGFKNALTMACNYGMTEVILLLLQREDIQTPDNIEAITNFVMREKTGCPYTYFNDPCVMDIKDTRDMRVVIEKAVTKNLPDIARWLAKTQGYLFRACTGTAALMGSNKGVKKEKTNRIFSLSGKFGGLTL